MTRFTRLGWINCIVLLAALACAGAWASGQVRSMRDRSEVAKMTEKMKTVCVGRFLVDVPTRAEVTLSREMMDGFEIETLEESATGFRDRVTERESEIAEHDQHDDTAGGNGLVSARDLRVPSMIGRVLVFGRTRSYSIKGGRRVDDEWVSIEAHAHLDGLSFSLSMKYADESDALAAEALFARLRLRAENEIPGSPGFCIGRAIFVDPLPPHKTEHISMHLGLPGHPDMGLGFSSTPGRKTGLGLLSRVADTDAQASADEILRVTKLRLGPRRINGIDGEEVLERVRELNFTTGYGFMWETRGIEDDPMHPFLLLQMETGTNPSAGGKPVDTSLNEDAVLALWDRILPTIRLRKPRAPAIQPG